MPYRSSVLFEVPAARYADFLGALSDEAVARSSEGPDGILAASNLMKEIETTLENMRQEQYPDRYIYFNDYAEWYNMDEVCGAIEEALYTIDGYTFIRTGEDREDCEVENGCDTPYIISSDFTLLATNDALGRATDLLIDIEKALPEVRQKAIAELEAVLQKLHEAEGGGVDDNAFEMEE